MQTTATPLTITRPLVTASKVPTFKKGATVAFVAQNGRTYVGTFVKKHSPTRVGPMYVIEVEGQDYSIRAQSAVGRSVTVQK